MASVIQFVGAGPGDPELITVKGKRLLEAADVIVYAGSLVNPALLGYAKESAEIFNSASMTLQEVLDVMVPAAQAGREVVRLHTGDPSIYGAIQEQMDALDGVGVSYEVVPGVSSFLATAAALKQEYTLPDVSQTVIVTRMEGRTPVPPKEKLASLASHQATMCIFLSVHMIQDVVDELIAGGYAPATPIAVVQRASWPDQRILRGRLNDIAAKAAAEGVDRTAMIVVGHCLDKEYELSRLYAPEFGHMFREAKKMKLAFFAVTAKGAKLAVTLAQVLPAAQVDVYAKHAESKEREVCLPLDSLAETVKLRFADCDGLVFFMALGIVVRMVGPLLVDKRQDPAVVAVDDGGHFAISVLSGHIGGANELTQQVAEAIDAVPVITTATDVSGAVAADVLAVKLGLKLEPFGQMKYINAALAAGKPVAFLLDETLPRATTWRERAAELGVDFQPLSAWQGGEECLVILSDRWQPALAAHMAHVLYLRPPSLLLGMGCRKGASVEVVAQAAQEALAAKGYSAASVASLGSAWVKLEEAGLQALAAAWQIPFICYEKESLAQAVKDYQLEQSNFVSQQIGVGNVCEAAACLQNQYKQGELVIPKTKRGPVTVAVVRGGLSS